MLTSLMPSITPTYLGEAGRSLGLRICLMPSPGETIECPIASLISGCRYSSGRSCTYGRAR
jgi:hypothetical protein